MNNFQTIWNPAGAGANYAYMTMGPEDDIFFLNAKYTQWKQSWRKYTPHQAAMMQQALANFGLGKSNVSCNLVKTPDFLYTSYVLEHFPPLQADTSVLGVDDTTWVNCPALFALQQITLQAGNQNIFLMDGQGMFVLCNLMGMLEMYGKMIGFSKTLAQLKLNSKVAQDLYAPMIGFPFLNRPDLSFQIGAVSFFNVTVNITTRPLNMMLVNWTNALYVGGALLPFNLENTNQKVTSNDVFLGLSTNNVWVSNEERLSIVSAYRETIFKEFLNLGTFTAITPTSATNSPTLFTLSLKGCAPYICFVVQSNDDVNNNKWERFCDINGGDWIKFCMLITGSTAREDGLPARFYREGKAVESFRIALKRYIYIFSFETNENERQFTGHQDFTNAESVSLALIFAPTLVATTVLVTVYASVLNGWYSEVYLFIL